MMMTQEDLAGILRENGCFDFLREPAKAAAEVILRACPDGAALLSDAAKQGLERGYRTRMEMLYLHPLVTKLQEKDPALKYAMVQETRELWAEAAARTHALPGLSADMGVSVKYPLIGEYAVRIRKNYIDSQTELLCRIVAYQDELSKRLFDGRPLGCIRSVAGDCGDLHRHGRSVQRVVTDAGAFYYKPHDCRFEALYEELVTRLFSDFTYCPKVLCGDGFGFEEELKSRELESADQAAEYFYHLGMLMALFHAMGSTDMHGENIMACGVLPAAIDLETLVRGRSAQAAVTGFPRQAPVTPLEEDLRYSVEGIGMLPNTILKGVYMSALHRSLPGGISLPKWQGEEQEIIGREEDFLRGFAAGYDRMLANRGSLKEMLRKAADIPVRYVARNTSYYFYMRSKLFTADAMASEEGRAAVLKRLEVPFTCQNLPILQDMLDYEIRCLSEGDIPYFCCTVDGHAFCGESADHVLREGYWEQSPAEVALCRLERLSPEEKQFEMDYIRTRLDHAPLPETRVIECPALPEQAATAETVRGLCGELMHQLEQESLRTASGVTIWYSGLLAIEKDASCGTATQQADALLFCSLVLSEPSLAALQPDAARIAEACLRQIETYAFQIEKESREYLQKTIPLDLAFGLGGILRGVAGAAVAGLKGANALLERFLRLICDNQIYRDQQKTGGEAGLILALKDLPEGRMPNDRVRELMAGCGEALLGHEPADSPMETALRGAALATVSRVCGKDRFAKAAGETFRQVREAYLPHILGWAEKKPEVAWLAASSGQEGGIALCAMIAADALGDGVCTEVRELALDSLARKQTLSHSDNLHDGNALSALALTVSAELSGRRENLQLAGRLFAGMIRRFEANGSFICSPSGVQSFFDVSVCYGTLGIGYAMLAWMKKEEETV